MNLDLRAGAPLKTFGLLMLALTAWGCATTLDANKATQSGFLGDYSQLKQVKEGEALAVYWNPSTDLSSYSKLIFENVELRCCPDSKLKEACPAELEHLVLLFVNALKSNLGRQYEIVEQPGSVVMRLSVALTEAKKSNVALDILTSLSSSTLVASEFKCISTGTQAFVGSASIKVKLADSVTGNLLFAEIDRRGGGKSIWKWSTDPWHDVQLIFDYWANQLGDELRGRQAQTQVKIRGS